MRGQRWASAFCRIGDTRAPLLLPACPLSLSHTDQNSSLRPGFSQGGCQSPLSFSHAHTHVHAHTYTHVGAHSRTHAHVHAYAQAHAHVYIHPCPALSGHLETYAFLSGEMGADRNPGANSWDLTQGPRRGDPLWTLSDASLMQCQSLLPVTAFPRPTPALVALVDLQSQFLSVNCPGLPLTWATPGMDGGLSLFWGRMVASQDGSQLGIRALPLPAVEEMCLFTWAYFIF